MLEKSIKTLEFDKIRDRLAEFCVNLPSKTAAGGLLPVRGFKQAAVLLDQTAEADLVLYRHGADPVVVYDPLSEILDKAAVLSVLQPGEILKAARLLRASRVFFDCIDTLNDSEILLLKDEIQRLYIDVTLEKEIERCILSEDEIADRATDELYGIRKKMRRCNEEVKEKLLSMKRSPDMQKYLQDAIVTMRSGRYVLPVKAEHRAQVSGLVHDQSATGATVFIEPIAVVEANNRLKVLMLEEQAEIERILKRFTHNISAIVLPLKNNIELLTYWDVCFAKAKYAKQLKALRPQLNSLGVVEIKKGRHPLISPSSVVPVSVRLGEGFRLLVITGPNTGGKTVTLKLCGLFCLMAMSGMFLPAEDGSKISVFNDIFCDIGDEQSIEQSLSTFSSHIKNIASIIDKVESGSLVLLDEVGAGTDPAEGSALALAITQELLASGCKGVLTTHYGELKEFSLVTDGIENASMEFNPQTFAPTYKLNMGTAGSSNAIEIAARLNLSPKVISKAREYLSQEKIQLEGVLREAELTRYEWSRAKDELETLKQDYSSRVSELSEEKIKLEKTRENLTKNAKIEAKQLISKTVSEADEILNELKSILSQEVLTEQSLFQARALKRKIEGLRYVGDLQEQGQEEIFELTLLKDTEIAKGKTVYVKSLSVNAVIEKISKNKDEYTVRSGAITARVSKDQLFAPRQTKKEQKRLFSAREYVAQEGYGGQNPASVPSDSVTEVKILGKTVDEALPMVDEYLNSAYLSGVGTGKIIHGVGTGALMRAVQAHLKRHPLVHEYRFGVYGEGEKGVTIVKFKNK